MKKPLRNKISSVLLISLFWLGGCSSLSQETRTTNEIPSDKGVVLEVRSQTSQTVYPPGNTLDLRLYSDREVEFDFYQPNTPDRIGISFEAEKKKDSVEQGKFDRIMALLTAPDLTSAKEFYGPTQRPLDATIKKTITFTSNNRLRTIVLEENDSHLHLKEKSGVIPNSLIELLSIVNDLNRELRRKINPESR